MAETFLDELVAELDAVLPVILGRLEGLQHILADEDTPATRETVVPALDAYASLRNLIVTIHEAADRLLALGYPALPTFSAGPLVTADLAARQRTTAEAIALFMEQVSSATITFGQPIPKTG